MTTRLGAEQLRRLLLDYARTGDPQLEAELLRQYSGLAYALASRLARGGDQLDDMRQQAALGLLRALRRFDPTRGVEFTTFAWVTVSGELKRSARDRSWRVHVPRALQEQHLEARGAVDDLRVELGREPDNQEVADRCGTSPDDVAAALRVQAARQPASLDAPSAGTGSADVTGATDGGFQRVDDRQQLDQLLAGLPPREQRILELRYLNGLKQSEIATQFGISQVHVSRLIARAIGELRRIAAGIAA